MPKQRMMLPSMLVCMLVFFTGAAMAQNAAPQGMTAIIDIDNHPVSIVVDDLPSCLRAIASRINNLKALTQDTYTVTSVVGQCIGRDGQLVASGRCGVRSGGQITRLCVPQMQ